MPALAFMTVLQFVHSENIDKSQRHRDSFFMTAVWTNEFRFMINHIYNYI